MLLKFRNYVLPFISVFLGLLVSLLPSAAFALSLGELTLNSALNEPFDATVQVFDVEGLDESQILFEIGTQTDFDQANIERIALLDQIEFNVEILADGNAVVHLTTTAMIVEPYLVFILNSRWPTGQLLREYTALMDLPFSNQTPVAEVQLATQESAQSADIPAEVIQAIPTTEDTVNQQVDDVVSSTISEESTFVVQTDDTLWDIALQKRVDNSVSIQQMMLAIQRENPEAFINNNINRLRSGEELIIPSMQEILALGEQEAVSQVAIQNQAFGIAQPLAVNSNLDAEGAGAEFGDELRVLSSDNIIDTSDLSSLQNQLLLSEESLDTARIENEELNSRLSDMESEISLLQNIIDVEDLRLAALQQELSGQADNEVNADPIPEEVTAIAEVDDSTTAVAEILPAQIISNQGFFGRISTLFQNSTLLIGGLVALIALTLGFLLWRGNSTEEDEVLLDEFASADIDPDTDNEEEVVDALDSDEAEPDDELEFDVVVDEVDDLELDDETDDIDLDVTETDDIDLDVTETDGLEQDVESDLDLEDVEVAETDEFVLDDVDVDEADEFELDEVDEADEFELDDVEVDEADEFEIENVAKADEFDLDDEGDLNEVDTLELDDSDPAEADDLQLDDIEINDLELDDESELETEVSESLDKNELDQNLESDELDDLDLDDLDLDAVLEQEDEDDLDEMGSGDVSLDELDIPVLEDEAELEDDSFEAETVLESSNSKGNELDLNFVGTDDGEDIASIETAGSDTSEDNLIEFPLKSEVFKMPEEHVDNTPHEIISSPFDSTDDDFEFMLSETDVDNGQSKNDSDEADTINLMDKNISKNASDEQDQYSTKLDLAVAYEAMGDFDGARSILREVVAAGNEAQVGEAKRLLEKRIES